MTVNSLHINPTIRIILPLLSHPTNRLPNHNIQPNILPLPLQPNLLLQLKPHLPINNPIHTIATLQITRLPTPVRHRRHILNRFPCIPFSATGRLRADVDEVPGVLVAGAHYGGLGVVEEGQEFVEEAAAAEGGELVGEAPHAGAQEGEVIVHVLGGGHPSGRF